MAQDSKKQDTAKKGVQKPSFFKRIAEGFAGIRREMKRVIWPNRKNMRESVTAVVIITVAVCALLFVTDSVMVKILDAAGFNRVKTAQSSEAPVMPVEEEPAEGATEEVDSEEADADETDAGETDNAATDASDELDDSSEEKSDE